jgi:hypothetical protein
MNINRISLQWFPFKASGQLHLGVLLIIIAVFIMIGLTMHNYTHRVELEFKFVNGINHDDTWMTLKLWLATHFHALPLKGFQRHN